MARIDDILANGTDVSKRDLRRYLASREVATPVDFGGVEGGVVDCAPAFAAALATVKAVFVPPGTWRIASPIVLGYGRSLFGVGDASVIQARDEPWDPVALPVYPSEFNAIEVEDGYSTVRDLKVVGGATAVKLLGRAGPCVRNAIENLTLWDPRIGLVLDGFDNPDRPCYWNHLARILIARPSLHGVLMTVESSGDTPNANKFHDVRVYSLSAPITGCGFFLSTARFNNSFLDCEANLHPSAEACFRLGAMTDQTQIINFYAECLGAVPGIRLDNGSQNTTILNLFSATGGAPIWDQTGARNYMAFNAGHPTTALLKRTTITDIKVDGLALETRYVEPAAGGVVEPDLTQATTWLVSAFGGPVEVRLPAALPSNGRRVTLKKTDLSAHPVTVTETSGLGPDGRSVVLANRHDFVEVVSNGAGWWIVAAHRLPLNAKFIETPGLVRPDLTQEFYAVSAQAGAVEVRLPPPGAAHAVGRRVVIKKTDAGGSLVTVTAEGGGGIEGRSIPLRAQYDSVDVLSNGAAWFLAAHTTNYGDVEFLEGQALVTDRAGRSFYAVSAYAGPVEFRLPAANTPAAVGKPMIIKKVDSTANAVTVTAATGTGPEGRTIVLANACDWVQVVSSGAAWYLAGGSAPVWSTAFIENTAFAALNPALPYALVSAWNGPVQAQLPDPASANAVGRTVTVKKIDGTTHAVTVTAARTGGPDGSAVTLGRFGDHVTVVSNGAQWYAVAGRYDTPIGSWVDPSGNSFNRGDFNADEIDNVGFQYNRNTLNNLNYRLQGTRAVLRALILDLKTKGVLG